MKILAFAYKILVFLGLMASGLTAGWSENGKTGLPIGNGQNRRKMNMKLTENGQKNRAKK